MTGAGADTALRADARRNLERILEAAAGVFAEQGLDASVADVAARAGVGTATIFRRFPHKDDLVAAVVERRVRELVAAAHAAADSDDAEAFRRFLQHAVELRLEDRCFCEAEGTALAGRERLGAVVAELRTSVRLVLERAQAAGHVRRDVKVEDIPLLVAAVAHAGRLLGPEHPGRWRRYLDILVDGLRPEGATPLTRRAPTAAELEHAKTARVR